MRNNNPLNIRHSEDKFRGEELRLGQDHDPEFKQFRSIEYGYRAACCIIRTYILKDYKTPTKIIRRWCPDATAEKYIVAVCARARLKPWEELRYQNQDKIVALVAAMSYVETGVEPDLLAVRRGYLLSY